MSISHTEYVEKKKALEAELKTHAKRWVAEMLKPALVAFEGHGISGIRWSQYTPYFNDGDPCVFWCHVGDHDVLRDDEWLDQYEFERTIRNGWPKIDPKDAGGAESFLAAFGDHCEVEARLVDGGVEFTVEEYDHD